MLALMLALAGCESTLHDPTEYHRHSMSGLREEPGNAETLWFEVRTDSLYPEDSEEAEAARMKWLQAWLDRRGLCPHGNEIVAREAIDRSEMNPYGFNLRYRLKCLPPSAAEAGG
jgi:hypothetical protein